MTWSFDACVLVMPRSGSGLGAGRRGFESRRPDREHEGHGTWGL